MVNHGPRRWSEVSPETPRVLETEGDSSLNLLASSVLASSSTGHSSSENPEAETCVFVKGCFSVIETSFGTSEASGVRTSPYYQLLTQ